jgi:LDH2 family malate/lactate/ureidoglycolate dehydrogenase
MSNPAPYTDGQRTLIAESSLRMLAADVLRSAGLSQPDADSVANVLVLADLFGISTHGVSRVPQYLNRVRLGGIRIDGQTSIEHLAPSLIRVDADNSMGPLAAQRALDAAMNCARQTGVAVAFVRRANHFGSIMPYLYLASEQGFASIIGSNATATVAPWGARSAKLGNSPLGIGVPNPGGDPVMLDIAMSTVARAKIREAAAQGSDIPDTWATDREGNPTTDPSVALDGFLQLIGGHKGYGLAVMIDMLAGVLSGASYLTRVGAWDKSPELSQDLGHFFILIDTAALIGPAELKRRVSDFAAILRSAEPLDDNTPIALPGEREMASYHRQLAEGISLMTRDVAALQELAGVRTES